MRNVLCNCLHNSSSYPYKWAMLNDESSATAPTTTRRPWRRATTAGLSAGLVLASLALVPTPAHAAPTTALEQAALGNVFTVGETIELPVRTDGVQVDWTITDFWGDVAATGTTPVENGTALVRPTLPGTGWYEAALTAVDEHGGTADTLETSLAVIPEAAPSATSRYGAMTHFAQGWDTDVMPLITAGGLSHIRDEAYWSQVETVPGQYVLPGYAENYIDAATDAGLEVLPVASFGNALYDVNPGGTAQAWSIRRWTAPSEATVNLTGWWRNAQAPGPTGDGTGFRIFVDGEEIYSAVRTETTAVTLSLPGIQLDEGSTVDIVVTPGAADAANAQYDGARYVIDIWLPGDPANSQTDFSGVQGEGGWTYGGATMTPERYDDYDPATDFEPLTWNGTRWQSQQFTWSRIAADYSSPDMRTAQAVSPYTDSGRAGYAAYADAMVDLFTDAGARPGALEIWNEWNGAFASGPATSDRPGYYSQLLATAADTLRAEHPDVTILGTASVQIPTGYLEDLFSLGALENMDALAVHPYVQAWDVPWPELVWNEIDDLNGQVARFNDGETMPVWMTEFGMSHPDRAYQATFNARQLALMSSFDNVERMYQYLLLDDGSFPYMGLLRGANAPSGPYTPNPAYVATAVLVDQIGDAAPLGRQIVDPLSEIVVTSFDDDGTPVRALWTTGSADTLRVSAADDVVLVDMMGGEQTLSPGAGGLIEVPLDGTVRYLRGDITVLGGTAELAVADSFLQFADTQGAGGWQYGYESDGELELMHYTPEFAWNWQWQGADDLGLKVTQPGGYPSQTDADGAAVRRWTSTISGPATISGLVGYAGLDYEVRVDGETVWSESLAAGTQHAYSVEVDLDVGSTVDLVLRHTDGTIDGLSDKTVFTARVVPLTAPQVATAAPGTFWLSHDNGWDNGLQDGDYRIAADLWWGENADRLTLTENGLAIAEVGLPTASPAAQHATFPVTGRTDGVYRYQLEATNQAGQVHSDELLVRVTDARPGVPVLRSMPGPEGSLSILVDMWWGTNGSSLSLTLDGEDVAAAPLPVATPAAQHWSYDVAGMSPGTYTFQAHLSNDAGTTSSSELLVVIPNP